MKGRLENKIKIEKFLQNKISDMPEYMHKYYYSMSSKSHTTKMRYIDNAIRFMNHFNGGCLTKEQLNNITEFDIQRYISDIKYIESSDGEVKELEESTQCNIYSCLWSFFTFLYRTKYIEKNPFDNIFERPTVKEKGIVYLEPEEVRKIESAILNNGVGSKVAVGRQRNWKYRDALLFRIPVVNGLRVTALSEINVEDIDLNARKIRVVEKGNISKSVDFDIKTASYIRQWLKDREILLDGKKEHALFISNQRTRITVRSIERIVIKYCDEVVPEKHITPHGLRRTCGTNTYKITNDIHMVSKILGHKTTSPTRRYAAVDDRDRTDVINHVAYLY